MPFKIGDRFESLSGFEGALEIFKAETNTDFSISDSKTLERAKNLLPRCRRAPEILKYYYVKYRCIHGAKYKKDKTSRGLRNTSTQALGCEAFIYLTLSEDASALVITSMYLEHNHDTNEILFTDPPRQRKKKRRKLRIKIKDLKDDNQERYKNKEKYLVHKKSSQETENVEISFPLIQDFTNFITENAQMSEPHETEIMNNPAENVSHTLPEGTVLESGEHELCKCGIGTWELTKQDLMLMEVEEHHRRLEILQLQEAYEIERIEKARYLQDLKIRKAEQELQNIE